MAFCSVTVDLDVFLDRDALFDEELKNVASVVTLQLDDVAILRIILGATIATPGFFEVFSQLFQVEVVWHTTH